MEFFSHFIRTLIQNRLKTVRLCQTQAITVRQFIIKSLPPQDLTIKLADYFDSNKKLKNLFLNLMRQLSTNPEEDLYHDTIIQFCQDLSYQLNSQQHYLNFSQIYKQPSNQSKKTNYLVQKNIPVSQINQENQNKPKTEIKTTKFEPEIKMTEPRIIKKDISQSQQKIFDFIETDSNQTQENHKEKNYNNDYKNTNLFKKSTQPQENQKKSILSSLADTNYQSLASNPTKFSFQNHLSGTAKNLLQASHQTEKLEVQLRYLKTHFNPNYQYNGFSVRCLLSQLVHKHFKDPANCQISIKKEFLQIRILDETKIIKSQQLKNYRLNPFHDAITIYLKHKNKVAFKTSFTIVGNPQLIEIKWIPLQRQSWQKLSLGLNSKSSIAQAAQLVCDKIQTDNKDFMLLKQSLLAQGTRYVQDLFDWTNDDYSRTKIKVMQEKQLKAIIQQIKQSTKELKKHPQREGRMECIRIGTSHKILRYLVYKLKGLAELSKLALLNFQNVKRAIKVGKQQIYNDELLDQLENYFKQFALDLQGQSISLSRGMILYGPPGTGKTVVTQTLPYLMGFHLIQKGLSAADFQMSLVGQTSRMIKALTSRASQSPYLACSIGIDEVDGLVPDRKDKDQKNKGQGISILLSVIEGNKDVPNLTYMTSTNYIKKIDLAIARRLNGRFQVGRPNPYERGCIIKKRVKYFEGRDYLLNHAISITTNFTGAALGGLSSELLKILILKQMQKQPRQLTIEEITKCAIQNAKKFSITFGESTLPEIYSRKNNKNQFLSPIFFKRIMNNTLVVQHKQHEEFQIFYANQIQKFSKGKLKSQVDLRSENISVKIKNQNCLQSFKDYINRIFVSDQAISYEFNHFQQQHFSNLEEYCEKIRAYCSNMKKIMKKMQGQNKTLITVLLIEVFSQDAFKILSEAKLIQMNSGFRIFYYLSQKTQFQNNKSFWLGLQYQNKKTIGQETGRIMIELSTKARAIFELDQCEKYESRVSFRRFLKSKQINKLNDAIPELVEFFTLKKVSYLLLIDQQLMTENSAYDEKKMLEVLDEKIEEVRAYKRSAVIIDADAIISLGKQFSNSSFGETQSYSFQKLDVYKRLVNFMKSYASTKNDQCRWLTIVVNDQYLKNMLKKDLKWPMYPQEIDEQERQQKMDEKKRCYRCQTEYTERDNEKQRKCMQHPGRIIDTVSKTFIDIDIKNFKNLRAEAIYRKKDTNMNGQRYVYACCMKGINQQGQCPYRHISKEQYKYEKKKDEHMTERKQRRQQWDQVLKNLWSISQSSQQRQKKGGHRNRK